MYDLEICRSNRRRMRRETEWMDSWFLILLWQEKGIRRGYSQNEKKRLRKYTRATQHHFIRVYIIIIMYVMPNVWVIYVYQTENYYRFIYSYLFYSLIVVIITTMNSSSSSTSSIFFITSWSSKFYSFFYFFFWNV